MNSHVIWLVVWSVVLVLLDLPLLLVGHRLGIRLMGSSLLGAGILLGMALRFLTSDVFVSVLAGLTVISIILGTSMILADLRRYSHRQTIMRPRNE